MKSIAIWTSLLFVLACRTAWADFGGPISATKAASPDGNIVVRIVASPPDESSKDAPSHVVLFYEFDASTDTYNRRSEFRLKDPPGELMFLSNFGDLVMINLDETDAIRLYAKDGKLVRKWSLNELLPQAEIEGCAQTGSTLQWLDEGGFEERQFYFNGPSLRIRALAPPYTVMRGANPKTRFSGSLDAKKGALEMDRPEEP